MLFRKHVGADLQNNLAITDAEPLYDVRAETHAASRPVRMARYMGTG